MVKARHSVLTVFLDVKGMLYRPKVLQRLSRSFRLKRFVKTLVVHVGSWLEVLLIVGWKTKEYWFSTTKTMLVGW